MARTWRVVFRGPVSDDVLAELPPDQMLWVTGHELRGQRSSTLWVQAGDANAAARAVENAMPVAGTVESAEPLVYSVTVEVAQQDVPDLERALAARRRATGNIGPVITPASDNSAPELLLDVDAETDDEAIDRAGRQYRELRHDAGLAPAEPIFRWLYPPWPDEQRMARLPRHRILLQRTRDLSAMDVFDGAVVAAQSAVVEVLVGDQIGQRLQREPIGELRGYILGGVRKHNLNDEPTQRLWEVLSGDTIKEAEAWPEYKRHLNRRNDIVHRGIDVAHEDAAASVAAAEAMIRHIESIPYRRL